MPLGCAPPTRTASPHPTPTPPTEDDLPIGAIVGGAIGGAAVIILGIALIVYLGHRRRQERYANGAPPMTATSETVFRHRSSNRLPSTLSQGNGVSPRTSAVCENGLGRTGSGSGPERPEDITGFTGAEMPGSVGRTEMPGSVAGAELPVPVNDRV